ncbi:MAG: patatin-like phospholipase family protein [Pseudomonadota bacterium]
MPETRLSLALQGGGAHGAFTWGVLDRILDEGALQIGAISGTGAGAMNACALAQGFANSGRRGAKDDLFGFWRQLSEIGAAAFNPSQAMPYQGAARAWNMDWSPASLWLDMLSQFVSPYQLNPLDHHPLLELFEERFDFGLLGEGPIDLFVSATNVKTNRARVFGKDELSADSLLASSCLPQLHRAVEVDGAFYWDGSFLGNPTLRPLVQGSDARDILLVQTNSILRDQLPISSRDILDRMNEIASNNALIREVEGIQAINQLIEQGALDDPRYAVIRFHQIADPETMVSLGVRSKINASWAFLCYLRDAGRACADRWLSAHSSQIGKQSTMALGEFAP